MNKRTIRKTFSGKIALAFLSMGLLIACDKSDIAENLLNPIVAGDTRMEAELNGSAWGAGMGAHYIAFGNGVSITGMGGGLDELMTLTLESDAEGEYTVNTAYSMSLSKGDDYYLAKRGKIVVTRNSGSVIEGTFEGELREDTDGSPKTIHITNGIFMAKPADTSVK